MKPSFQLMPPLTKPKKKDTLMMISKSPPNNPLSSSLNFLTFSYSLPPFSSLFFPNSLLNNCHLFQVELLSLKVPLAPLPTDCPVRSRAPALLEGEPLDEAADERGAEPGEGPAAAEEERGDAQGAREHARGRQQGHRHDTGAKGRSQG